MLHADIRHRAVVDDVHAVVRHGDAHGLDVVGADMVLGDERGGGVEHRLDRRADAPLLDRGRHDLEAVAELVREQVGLRRLAKRRVEVIAAREWIVHTGTAGCHHQRAGNAVARPHAAEVECLLDVLAVAMPIGHAGGLLGRIREHMAHALGIEAQKCGCGRRRPEGGAEAVGAVAGAIVGRAVAERHGEPCADVVAERDRAQEGRAVAILQLGDRERRRHDAAAGMKAAAQMRVVGLVGMA